MHWIEGDPHDHFLLRSLGPEPLSEAFDADYLFTQTRDRRISIKNLLMNAHVVVGIGNIYANESLFRARINPMRAAGRISRLRIGRLVTTIKEVLDDAIKAGGTTLRDFVNSEGEPGYFTSDLRVYGREGKPCLECGKQLQKISGETRSAVFCPGCQRY